MEVDAIIGDAAYSGKENLKMQSEQNIKIVARLNPSLHKVWKDEDKDLITTKMPTDLFTAGHLAIRKARGGTKNVGKNPNSTPIIFWCWKCKVCPRWKKVIYKDDAKSKNLFCFHQIGLHQDQMVFRKAIITKEKSNTTINRPKTVDLWRRYTGTILRATSYGIENSHQMQGAMAIFRESIWGKYKLL